MHLATHSHFSPLALSIAMWPREKDTSRFRQDSPRECSRGQQMREQKQRELKDEVSAMAINLYIYTSYIYIYIMYLYHRKYCCNCQISQEKRNLISHHSAGTKRAGGQATGELYAQYACVWENHQMTKQDEINGESLGVDHETCCFFRRLVKRMILPIWMQ